MNKVSITINGVKYDAVEADGINNICKSCDLTTFCDEIPGFLSLCDVFDIKEGNRHFKTNHDRYICPFCP